MKMVTFHGVVAGTGAMERLMAFNEEDIMRLEELEMGTAIHQGDRGPVLVRETMKEVMEELGQKLPEEEEEPKPGEPGHPGQPPHPEPEHPKPEPAPSRRSK